MTKQLDSNNVPNDVFRHDLHIELWDWLAKNPGKEKHEWPRWWDSEVPYAYARCFACAFDANDENINSASCENCPFGNFRQGTSINSEIERCLNGLYFKWHANGKPANLAKQIRDFPLRKDWQWKTVLVK